MWKHAILICALTGFGLLGCQKKPGSDTPIPPEEANQKNPIDLSPASIAEGQRLYHVTDCAMCHGKDGEGKGVLAKDVNMSIHNWKDPASLSHFTDGELYYIVVKGKGRMPGYGGRETPEQIWHMVNYLHSMAGNEPAPKQ